ncbi:unnamed protein product [Rotaria magnacalcarata]|uniref:Magnesium transporter protein 1 n=1 Tax=Rotaria magnacalcarata TaxID=392030 RepID=A0A816T573_9BILA|nr:unnamed protein product [Rotaria magnacalcarata]
MILKVLSKEDVLSEKVRQLTDLSLQRPLIRLNSERFKYYVTSQPRNYSVFVMLTALAPERKCGICQDAHNEYELVARSYRYSNAFSKSVFFAMVDFDEASDIFQSLKLNSAPVFIHFPPKMSPKKSDYMDIHREFSAEQVAKWVHEISDIRIQLIRPPNYTQFLPIVLIITAIFLLFYIKRETPKIVYSPIIWGIITVGLVCYYISGQTWNRINKPPFTSQRKTDMGLFADDSNMQYVAETYIVRKHTISIDISISIGIVLLNEAPNVKSRRGIRKSIMAFVGLVTVVILFSLILSIFRSKYQGYPYSFLIK